MKKLIRWIKSLAQSSYNAKVVRTLRYLEWKRVDYVPLSAILEDPDGLHGSFRHFEPKCFVVGSREQYKVFVNHMHLVGSRARYIHISPRSPESIRGHVLGPRDYVRIECPLSDIPRELWDNLHIMRVRQREELAKAS